MTRFLIALIPLVLACGCQKPADPATPLEDVAKVEPNEPPPTRGAARAVPNEPPPLDDAAKTLAASNAEFAIDLYHQLRGKPGNIVISPYSISAALAMTYDGARGETAEQMAKVLHFPSRQQLNPAFSNLNRNLTAKADGFEMTAANALWPRKGIELQPEFLKNMKEFFGTSVESLDYVSARDAARETINDWTSRHTREKIKELIGPSDLTPRTTLVLTNAVYSKGEWAKQFSAARTTERDFHVSPDRTVKTPMMHQEGQFPYFRNEKLAMLELPYRGERASFVAVLPKTGGPLSELERELSLDVLNHALTALKPHRISVMAPRLKLKYREYLRKHLIAMNMTLPFRKADFSGIGPVGGIDEVIHEATLDVDEKGVVATAATAVLMKDSAPPQFIADRPFLFLIRDRASGSILFIGRVVDPTI